MAVGWDRFKAFGDWKDVIKKFPVEIEWAAKIYVQEFFFAPARFSFKIRPRTGHEGPEGE